jgi:DNA-binding response OmpR family regulator
VAASDGSGGALLYKKGDDKAWSELSLPPLEFQLLRVLCARAVAEADSPAKARGCVPTKDLARDLPFQSKYANEENVRQVVRRARATLGGIGAGELIAAAPGRGYYLDWKVEKG